MAQLTAFEAAAFRLKKAEPQAFDDFIKALEDKKDRAVAAMADAPPDGLQMAQGQVRQLLALIRSLKECSIERPQPGAPITKV
jgi:hypothetical protein